MWCAFIYYVAHMDWKNNQVFNWSTDGLIEHPSIDWLTNGLIKQPCI